MDGLGILECSLESFTAVRHDLQYYLEGLELTVAFVAPVREISVFTFSGFAELVNGSVCWMD